MIRAILPLAALLAGLATTVEVRPVEVHLSNVGPKGTLFVQVCTEAELAHGCHHQIKATPHPGETVVTFPDIAPGRYQVSAFQDVDGNNRLSFGMMGAPVEPWGYSRDAKAIMGPPIFADAAVEIGTAPAVIPIHLGNVRK